MSRHFNTRLKTLAAAAAIANAVLFQSVISAAQAEVTAAPPHGVASATISGGDSRMNNYRLERDSCCVGER